MRLKSSLAGYKNESPAAFVFVFGCIILWQAIGAEQPAKYSYPPAPGMERADIYSINTLVEPAGVLVLCPGRNGSGKSWITQPDWGKFATDNDLGLIGLSFASAEGQKNGYYYASKGSGKILLDAVRKIYGKDLPLLLYGFSGGAYFTSRFVEWKPDRVVSWCAYSASFWDDPKKLQPCPPGIVACGEDDVGPYGESFMYFKKGRVVGKPWTWVSLPKTGHVISPTLETFVRDYFAAVLARSGEPEWVDVDNLQSVSKAQADEIPAITAWLPNKAILARWKTVHHP